MRNGAQSVRTRSISIHDFPEFLDDLCVMTEPFFLRHRSCGAPAQFGHSFCAKTVSLFLLCHFFDLAVHFYAGFFLIYFFGLFIFLSLGFLASLFFIGLPFLIEFPFYGGFNF
jgi:hypothetical protein